MSIVWMLFAGLMLAAGVCDFRSYKIPNWISVALIGLFLVAALSSGASPWRFWPNLALGAAALGLGYFLYAFTNMGAGDAKLAAAAAVWAGVEGLYAFCLALAVAMALLALGLIAARMAASAILKAEPALRVLKRGAPAPLGVAIAAAAVAASRYIDSALWSF